MKRAAILIMMLAAVIGTMARDGLRLNSRRVTVQDGLLGNTVNALVQDEEGYIWMATNNGLTRYDGYSTVNFTSLSTDAGHRLEARIGRLFLMPGDHRLWLSTATYQNACYDLRQARFIDWTGRGDHYRRQNKLKPTSHGMVVYGLSTGATLSGTTDGRRWAHTYTSSDGQLPSDDVLTVVEDSAHNIFLPTAKGIAVVASRHLERSIVLPFARQTPIMAAATSGTLTCFLDGNGEAWVVDRSLRLIRTATLPAALGRPTKVNVSFIWQGRWMLFTPEGTYALDLSDGTFQKPAQWQVDNGLDQGQCPGYHFVANSTGQLWMFPDDGSPVTLDLIPNARLSAQKGRKYAITPAAEGRLFIATYGNGLFVYDTESSHLDHFTAADAHPVIDSDYLLCAITDRQGCVWMGSETSGAYCLSPISPKAIGCLLPQPGKKGGWDNAISTVAEHDGRLIIGTRDGRLYQTADGEGGGLRLIGQRQAAILTHLTDSKDRVWTGTWGDGLYLDDRHYTTGGKADCHIASDFIADITEDRSGRVWIATWNGGVLLYEGTAFRQFLADNINGSRIRDLEQAPDGTLWAATNNGIARWNGRSFDVLNTANKGFVHDEVNAISADGDSILWVATAGGGVARCVLSPNGHIAATTLITTRDGLANNNVVSIVKDRQGLIWVGTEDGLSRINPQTGIVSSFRLAETPQGNVMSARCALAGSNGHLLFGTADGLLIVDPRYLTPPAGQARQQAAILTELLVNGQPIHELHLLTTSLSIARQVCLGHSQNSLSLRFSNFSYGSSQQPVYQYLLEGYEHDWHSAPAHRSASGSLQGRNQADYKDLSPGRYVFRVRSLSDQGVWTETSPLTIIIAQPWWNTWWAWLLYLLAAALLGWYLWSNWKEKFDLHQQMKLERQLNDFRTQFFTHIAHEFRTPLAIIKGAVDRLQGDRATLQTAQRGTQRLLRLVNLFMDFRKAQTGNLHLHVSENDIVGFVKKICQDFWPLSQQREQRLTFTPFARSHTMLFDGQMVETIVYNLLSNAVKYTPESGSISVSMQQQADRLAIIVENDGPGLSMQQQEALFKPFMQGLTSQGGMGIGLYTAQLMAQAHHGQLCYERMSAEGGTRFTLSLPANEDAYTAEELDSSPASKQPEQADGEVEAIIRQMTPEALNDLSIAIIEDDADMMEQIRGEMGRYFHTDCYTNGRKGLEGVTASVPALLICDVMLPDMDGYDIVRRLRSQPATCHLPVIMLTALNDEHHQVRAYQAGADDYMVKPCNWRLLAARAIQLVRWSSAAPSSPLHALTPEEGLADASTPQQPVEPGHPASLIITQADKVFLDRLAMYVAQHLREEDFSIDQLAQLMAMGRTKFYGRVKELTGLSPNKYLMQERMKKAADLLAGDELTVSEVSYQVGIQDPGYFNKCFKSYYGVTPSKYAKTATPTSSSSHRRH